MGVLSSFLLVFLCVSMWLTKLATCQLFSMNYGLTVTLDMCVWLVMVIVTVC